MVASPRVNNAVEQARHAISRGHYEQALLALNALKPVPERRADFWLIKGSAHLGMGQLQRADSAFSKAFLLTPDNAQIAVQRAIIKQEEGNHTEALEILKNVAARHPDVPEVFLNQGYSQQVLGMMKGAESSFRVFLKLTQGRSLYAQQRYTVQQWLAQFRATRN